MLKYVLSVFSYPVKSCHPAQATLQRMNKSSDILSADRCDTLCLHPETVKPLLGRVLDRAGADPVGETFALLADGTRLRVLHALSMVEELCVCDLALLLGISQSALSHQLRLLR